MLGTVIYMTHIGEPTRKRVPTCAPIQTITHSSALRAKTSNQIRDGEEERRYRNNQGKKKKAIQLVKEKKQLQVCDVSVVVAGRRSSRF